jgi:hypothetical protein
MYSYITDAIAQGRISAVVGNGSGYDDLQNPHAVVLPSADPAPRPIVHEATHAVIDATHKGQKILKGDNEAAAFLAESVYGLLAGEPMGPECPSYFSRAFRGVAEQIRAFNSTHASGLFPVPPGDAMNLKALIGNLPFMYSDVNKVEIMKGIGD